MTRTSFERIGPSVTRRTVAVCLGLVLAVVAEGRPAGGSSPAEADPAAEAEDVDVAFRIDRSADTPEWGRMIAAAHELPQIRSGQARMTLMRVVLEKGEPGALIQLVGPKLAVLGRNSGGGAYAQIESGGFVLVDHVNSTYRRDGKDAVEIGSFGHRRATLRIDVPPPRTVAVLGDVIVSAGPAEQMGRIEATVTPLAAGPLKLDRLQVGPVAVGGLYGKAFPFGADGTCDTGPIAPGPYKILLPDFDIKTSRWTVDVSPGKVTRLHFVARSQEKVERIELSPDDERPIR